MSTKRESTYINDDKVKCFRKDLIESLKFVVKLCVVDTTIKESKKKIKTKKWLGFI